MGNFKIKVSRNGFDMEKELTDQATSALEEIISITFMPAIDVIEHCLLNLFRNHIDKSIPVVFKIMMPQIKERR